MYTEYDYNFVSTVNRAYSLYPERLSTIIYETLHKGTAFQRAFICALIDYMHNRGDYQYNYTDNTILPELTVPEMVSKQYSKEAPIPEFMSHNVYTTKVGWP